MIKKTTILVMLIFAFSFSNGQNEINGIWATDSGKKLILAEEGICQLLENEKSHSCHYIYKSMSGSFDSLIITYSELGALRYVVFDQTDEKLVLYRPENGKFFNLSIIEKFKSQSSKAKSTLVTENVTLSNEKELTKKEKRKLKKEKRKLESEKEKLKKQDSKKLSWNEKKELKKKKKQKSQNEVVIDEKDNAQNNDSKDKVYERPQDEIPWMKTENLENKRDDQLSKVNNHDPFKKGTLVNSYGIGIAESFSGFPASITSKAPIYKVLFEQNIGKRIGLGLKMAYRKWEMEDIPNKMQLFTFAPRLTYHPKLGKSIDIYLGGAAVLRYGKLTEEIGKSTKFSGAITPVIGIRLFPFKNGAIIGEYAKDNSTIFTIGIAWIY
ncbi:MAG: hypothetical protein V3V14_12085 [Saprospiraceae bacterium]